MTFFSSTLGVLISAGTVLTVIILYLLGLWKQGSNKNDDRLITILQGTVDALEGKVNNQTAQMAKQSLDMEALTKEVQELKRDNAKYIEILQGRDQETKDFYKQAYAAMDKVSQSHDILTTVAESIKNTNDAMQKLIELIVFIPAKLTPYSSILTPLTRITSGSIFRHADPSDFGQGVEQ